VGGGTHAATAQSRSWEVDGGAAANGSSGGKPEQPGPGQGAGPSNGSRECGRFRWHGGIEPESGAGLSWLPGEGCMSECVELPVLDPDWTVT